MIRVLAGLAWGIPIVAGMHWMNQYEGTPGASGNVAPSWPEASRVTRAKDRFTLILAIHPRCACSRASVAQLNRVVARCGERLAVRVLDWIPSDANADWGGSRVLGALASAPNIEVFHDRGGVEMHRFNVVTSGHALLYNGAGRLVFSGGLTASRSNSMDNAASESVIAWVLGASRTAGESPVFGCVLIDPRQLPKASPP